jgi:hypothetical protein
MARAMSLGEPGSTPRAASPVTSGSEEVAEAIVGTPRAIASRTGRPNPSYNDGYTNTDAPR